MENTVYFDNSATTKPCEKSKLYLNNCLDKLWGNPSATHALGVEALLELNDTRAAVAKSIGAKSEEIIFTSCGSEANNLAIYGGALALKKRGNRVITTVTEHPSVLEVFSRLKEQGFEIVKINVNSNGSINREALFNAINEQTVLVSAMLVNNEIGSINDIADIRRMINEKHSPALLHCDAVQGYGKLCFKAATLGADLISVSGHKIHAPKGIGFLYKKSGVRLIPIISGGGQESGNRSGTESMPLIASLKGAIEEIGDINKNLQKVSALCNYAKARLLNTGLVTINSPESALPYILNISVNGYKAEPILNALSIKGIFVSKGSACAKGQRSYVLSEIGLSTDRIDSAIRLSFCKDNTSKEVDVFIEALTEITSRLRRFK